MSLIGRKCREKAEAEGYAGLMNDTKWRELCATFAAFNPPPAWRTRDLLNSHLSAWDSEWFYHVGPEYCAIEWMEIDPKTHSREKILAVLNKVGVPFQDSDIIRVLGYQR